MISTSQHQTGLRRRHAERQSERVMMKRLVWLVFPICLVSTISTRLSRLFSSSAGPIDQSVYAEAKAAAYAAIGYAFHA